MSVPLQPQIVVKGGQDLDGSWGPTKTFAREFYFELFNVPLPMFLVSNYIPAYNSLHPLYPFALAKDSKITKNLELKHGRAVTVTTNYQILKTTSAWWAVDNNTPYNLPAQDISYEPVAIEEPLNDLFIQDQSGIWNTTPFQTSSGTKLTGTRIRNIQKMSFWYFADPQWFSEADVEREFTGTVNADPIIIAGRACPPGTAKIESIELIDNTWERESLESLSMKIVQVSLLLDNQTWLKRYENVSNLFTAYPYQWEDSESGKADTKMVLDEITGQPLYDMYSDNALSSQRIFCTSYDPNPTNIGSESSPIYESDPKKAIQFFGTREECFRLNPDSEPTEVSEPMYLDGNGFMLYPDPNTGKVNTTLSPKVQGYVYKPMFFSALHFPIV